jgi:hypothetical protein
MRGKNSRLHFAAQFGSLEPHEPALLSSARTGTEVKDFELYDEIRASEYAGQVDAILRAGSGDIDPEFLGFASSWDAGNHYFDIPARAGYRSDIFNCSNKNLLQHGRVL